MQKLPIVDDNGKVLSVENFPGDEQPDIMVMDKKFYTRDPAGFYRSATAYITTRNTIFSKDGIEQKL